jgi:branched-subunit amino acid ABC-type transport system permease component
VYYVELLVAGLLAGAAYSLSALGIVVIYKGSGVLNFAQGAVGMVATFVYANARHGGKPLGVSLLLGLGTAAVLGLAIYVLVMRPLRYSPPSVRMVASFAVLLILEGIGQLRWGNNTASVPYPIKQHNYHWHGVTIGTNDILSIGVAILITVVLAALFRVTTAGRATEAAALSEQAAMRLGYRVNLLAAGTWVLGSVLAGVGGILIAPSIGLTITNLTLIMIAAFAAALVGGFRSLGITTTAAFGIGAVESLLTTAFITQPGWSQAVPFFVIVLVLALRGSGIPSRIEAISERLPLAPYPRLSWPAIIFSVAALVIFPLIMDPFWQLQSQLGVGLAIVVVSLVPLTGFLGQISLMQWGVAGAGAFLAGAFATNSGVPMVFALLIAAIIAFGMGTIIALPMLRIRGIDVAIVTLGAGIAIQELLLGTYWGTSGLTVKPPDLFGVALSQRQFLYVSEVILGIVVLGVWLLRRGAYGQHLLAARASERAAAACGLRTGQLKLWTFGLSCAIAAIGGGLYGFGVATLNTQSFDPVTSTQLLAFAFINGIGSIMGAAVVGLSIALGPVFLSNILHVQGSSWFSILGGIGVVLTIIRRPDGAFVKSPSHRGLGQQGLDLLRKRRAPAPAANVHLAQDGSNLEGADA